MANFEVTYLGGLRTEAIHLQSGTKILTDAPTDNQGKGEAFSPTDLLAVSLATCMLTTMAIRDKSIDIDNTKCEITKIMAANPRRVSEVQITFKFPHQYTPEQQKTLEGIAFSCPVYESIHPDMVKTVDFGW